VSFTEPDWRSRESSLLERVRRGDRAAFEALYAAYAMPLYHRLLLPRLGDAQLAADALAETFRTFLEHVDGFEDRGKGLWGWLATLAINKANDQFRAQARCGRALSSYQALLEPLWQEAQPARPDEAHDREQLKEAVTAVLGTINPRYQQVIELRVLQDRPRAECAAALAVTLGTFDVLLLRALRAFRARWQERYPSHEASP
jgi:RNA polymerase sigma-70 factor (ECF subfamily)